MRISDWSSDVCSSDLVAAGRGGPRDLAQLRAGLEGAAELKRSLQAMADRPSLLDDTLGRFGAHGTLTDLLSRPPVAEPPVHSSAGGFLAPGSDPALYAFRQTAHRKTVVSGKELSIIVAAGGRTVLEK